MNKISLILKTLLLISFIFDTVYAQNEELSGDYLNNHPIIYVPFTNKVSFIDKSTTIVKISIKPLTPIKCKDLEYATASGPRKDSFCLGLLENKENIVLNAEVLTNIGTLKFSGNLQLSNTENNFKTTLEGVEYKLKVKISSSFVRVRLNTSKSFLGLSLGTFAPCYYIFASDLSLEQE